MRKLALLLGSLVVVASASAKEVVPAPVVVEEAPVQIVEKEVIVYRDKEEGFRPNGYVDLQYRYYGDTEGQNEDFGTLKDKKDPTAWNGKNNASRIQLQGKVNMTENQALEFRVRDWNDLDQENARQKNGTETRLRYFYDHGNLGDSKVNFTSRVHYLDKFDNTQELEYSARFNFAEYMFNNDFVKTTNFELVPFYNYSWASDNSSNYTNTIGARLKSNYDLPWGFTAEFNLYANQNFYGTGAEKVVKDGDKAGKEDKEFVGVMEAYLYHTLPLYSNDKLSVTFNNEVAYDPYTWSQYKAYDKDTKEESNNATYEVYFLSTIGVNYQVTPNVALYANVGGEYRNWTITSDNSASNWRWQPTAWAGFRTTF